MGDRFPTEGREVERDVIIERRIIEGALIIIDDPTAEPPGKPISSQSETKSAASKAR